MIAEKPREEPQELNENQDIEQNEPAQAENENQELDSKNSQKSLSSIVIEKKAEILPPSRYSFVHQKLAKWVDDILGCEAIERLGEKPHPVEVLFELTAHWVPELRNMPNIWKTPKNRLKSKLRKVREFFIAWGIQSPLHWCSFVEFDERDQRIVLNYNLTIAAMKNHFLVEENNNLINAQYKQLLLCRELQKESEAQRKKLQKVLEIVDKDQTLPFRQLTKELITKEPTCFKPMNVE